MSGRTPTMTVEERKQKHSAYMREYRKTHPMSEERKRKTSEYVRQYKQRNPEKTKQYDENYIIRKAARILAERDAGKEI